MSAKTSISELDLICNQSHQAKIELRRSKKLKKDDALKYAAEFLILNKAKLIDANSIDMELAHQKDLQDSFIDRLELNEKRIESMISGLEKVINLDDPVGQITAPHTSPSGFEVSKMRVPLGVIGIIYESRPNVTADASALCLKSGNACILRGGSEAANSNAVIEDCMQKGLEKASLPKHSIQLIKNQDRKVVQEMIKREKDIDLLIPRGGKSLIKVVSDEAKIPVLKHYEGLCHVFIDKDADIKKAVDISVNAKTYRYGICGTMETLLISEDVADVEDVDNVISNGPGLRLALLGPHMNYHLGGGEGGYRYYLEHLGPSQEARWKTLGQTPLTSELKEKLIQGIEKQNISMSELKTKRDDSLIEILKIKKAKRL